ncbi:beta-N-acetylglucosaminidase domain-containing protein [Trueperella sp.]|uniref:beta-N-acetylglucosaminidase domain-containing protein n=1 Tax=Trueperella sp. TaxID=2699835 RepID=UPI002620AA3A|nr:beta-N-acetylglucosaminidase domain-containing protein [Trueperella sp.]
MTSHKRLSTRYTFAFATIFAFMFSVFTPMTAAATDSEYQIYPTPHSIEYGSAELTLGAEANVVVEDGIDAETRARLDETLKLKGIRKAGDDVVTQAGKLQVLVGVKGSGGVVDKFVDAQVEAKTLAIAGDHFTAPLHHDAYVLAVIPGTGTTPASIVVLGKDTDSAFYGLSTLYRIFQQTTDKVRVLTIADYADVITRGFIEGYYGEPWSTADRIELMRWGGYNKLNAYVYAPKDDPKHNAKWDELYTADELREKVAPLAKAGNDSKVRFVYALHPFMNSKTRITPANYDQGVAKLKAKFEQVIDAGVRQIAILADDAPNQGTELYTRLLNDMTQWLEEEQAVKNDDGTLKYPGLKKTLIFCPVAYYGFGEAWYARLPQNIQVVNTGGRVWGKVEDGFVSRFQKNAGGRSPFMWINWPCSDNDKDALHMGGHNAFLGANVRPGSVEGVVLNPMQQSEPSKHAIFMNADFTWNLWNSAERADRVWEDSFSYVDHNSPVTTEASTALRNLSEHMRRIFGGRVVFENAESASVKDELAGFQRKADAGEVTSEDIEKIRGIFTALAADAATFRDQAGTPAMLSQIMPWIDAWSDLTKAADFLLDSYRASLTGDSKPMVDAYTQGVNKLKEAANHGFSYIDHTEYARVGKMYLWPFVESVKDKLAEKVVLAAGPQADLTAYVTSRTDAPADGVKTEAAYDGSQATKLIYKTPNTLTKGTYFGLLKSKPFSLTAVQFFQGDPSGKDYMDHSKVQYFDGKQWVDVPGATDLTGSKVQATGLNIDKVYGVRLIATADNRQDAWPTIADIKINDIDPEPLAATLTATDVVTYRGTPQLTQDGDDGTIWWIHSSRGDKTTPENVLTLAFDEPTEVGSLRFAQTPSDVIAQGVVEYTADGGETWTKLGDVDASPAQKWMFDTVIATAIRLRPTAERAYWWKVGELTAFAPAATPQPEPTPVPTPTPTPEPGLEPTVSVDPTKAEVGSTLKIKAVGFGAGEAVKVTVHSDPVTVFAGKVDPSGNLVVSWKIPEDFELGEHTVRVTGEKSQAEAEFEVIAGHPSPTPTPTDKPSDKPAPGQTSSPGDSGKGDVAGKGDVVAQAPAPEEKLSFTGSQALPLTVVALLLGGVGVALTLRARRKN